MQNASLSRALISNTNTSKVEDAKVTHKNLVNPSVESFNSSITNTCISVTAPAASTDSLYRTTKKLSRCSDVRGLTMAYKMRLHNEPTAGGPNRRADELRKITGCGEVV